MSSLKNLLDADVLSLATAVRTRQISAVDLTRAFLANIAEKNSLYNCFTAVTEQRALKDAREIDVAVAAGKPLGPLAGVPYAVKNLFDIEGVVTLAGSRINVDLPPAPRDACVVQNMHDAGAILLGTLNMDEYAYGFTNENSHYGAVRNPHDRSKIAGGSSGGSAAAVASGLVPLTLGSDTNGSVRLPAALCGTFGLRPTFGRVDRTGCFPLAFSLDTVGAFARSVTDLSACYDAMLATSAHNATGLSEEPHAVSSSMAEQLGGLRIAMADDYFDLYAEKDARHAVKEFASVLQTTRKVTLPEAGRARAAAYVITAVEAGNLHLPNLRKRPQDFEPLSRNRLVAGAISPAAWYVQAQRFRQWFQTSMAQVFETVDVILAPAVPCSATPIGATSVSVQGHSIVPRAYMGMLTQPISLIGLPTITVPFLRHGQMPLGVQIIAAPWREDLCFRVAHALEKAGATYSRDQSA